MIYKQKKINIKNFLLKILIGFTKNILKFEKFKGFAYNFLIGSLIYLKKNIFFKIKLKLKYFLNFICVYGNLKNPLIFCKLKKK